MHFFDFLKEQVLKLPYKKQISDRRIFDKPNYTETIERHYLKPRPTFLSEKKLDQKYGNITIELLLRNNQPHLLKFSATSYTDSKYQKAKTFKELLGQVLAEGQ